VLISYGRYTFPIGWAALFIARTAEVNDAMQQLAIVEDWTLTGAVLGDTPAAVLSRVAQLEAAFSIHNQDLKILVPDTKQVAGALISRECIGGTRVVTPVNYPNGTGTEYVNRRSFTVTVRGKKETPGASGFLRSYSDTISYVGNGGPSTGHLEPLNGYPIKMQTRQRTLVRATQSGSAVGYLAYPVAPTPIFPFDVLNHTIQISYGTPHRLGDDSAKAYIDFPVTWSYQFELTYRPLVVPYRW